ncbi:unnamed protein product [Cylicocyclus nassatus]|uniref:Uncharacterized protein n=1 Tax=Cylicocyclus nassatus TaxID=53992 RepID=A0AA36GSB7_CYLNA|nr:unnamed protein product [Cylicocyclus nassatus]
MGDDEAARKKAFDEVFNPNSICAWLCNMSSEEMEEWKNMIAGFVYKFREVSPPPRARGRRGGARPQQAHRYEPTDKIKARFWTAKANVNTWIADGSVVEVISGNWARFGLIMNHGIRMFIEPGSFDRYEFVISYLP